MIWDPAKSGGQVPRLEVAAGLDHLMSHYAVARGYFDPPYWATEIDAWAQLYGDTVILRWPTFRDKPMHAAAERLVVDVNKQDSGFTHDACEDTGQHVSSARKAPRLNGRYVLSKPGDGRKIDLAVISILTHEAHGDMTAAGWPELVTGPTYFRLPR